MSISEVLKLLLEKKNDLEKLTLKYQVVLSKYLEKCKQFQRLKEECDSICLSNDEQETKVASLVEELNSLKAEYAKLQNTYVEYMNTAQLQYKSLNLQLCTTQKKLKEHEKQVSVLETTIGQAKKKCRRTVRNAHEQESSLVETACDGTVSHTNETKENSKIQPLRRDSDAVSALLAFVEFVY